MRASPRSGMVGTRLVDVLMDSSCPLRAGPNGHPGRGRGITRALVRVDPRPSAALLFTALTVPSMAVLRPLLTAGDLLLLPAMLGFALRLAPVSGWLSRGQALRVALLAAAVAIWLEPVWTTLRYSQIDVLIGALVLYDLSRPDGSRWKGAASGLAIGLKLTPVIFALYLLLSRRYRAAAVSAGGFCLAD